jgi:acid phosphatase
MLATTRSISTSRSLGQPGSRRRAKTLCALVVSGVLSGLATLSCCPSTPPLRPDADVLADLQKKVKHIIVIYQENWSFDGLYGKFPGANGIANAGAAINQAAPDGTRYDRLPQPNVEGTPATPTDCDPTPTPDKRFPVWKPVAPFDINQDMQPDQKTGDLVHRYYHEQLQIDHGKMDQFVAWSDNPGLVMGYFDATNMPEGQLAAKYVLCDNFFHSAFGGSFLNHQFLIAAAPPVWQDAVNDPDLVSEPPDPAKLASMKPADLKDKVVTPEGYVVNTAYTSNTPHPAYLDKDDKSQDKKRFVPQQTNPTIGDRLTDKKVSWKWYSGGWNRAVAKDTDPTFQCQFQFHHQPFAYYKNYADGTQGRRDHLADEEDFKHDLALRPADDESSSSGEARVRDPDSGLPSVCFIKPFGPDNEHPGYADLARGQQHVADLVTLIEQTKYWDSSVVIIVYDENGGRWDHVAPPVIDAFGPGSRVPCIVISPMAKEKYVDHTQYETVSILAFIESIFGLQPLTARDAKASNLLKAFK